MGSIENEEPCGDKFEIDAFDIIQFGSDKPVASHEGTTLTCSRPLNHTPRNRHSDGVTDWIGEE